MNIPATPAADNSSAASRKPRLLVAEDEPGLREVLCELLQPFYQVEAVADGELAWQALNRTVPALLLTDLQMPSLDGLGLILRVRAQPAFASLRIVLLTACDDEELSFTRVADGPDHIMLKPFRCDELLACLQVALSTQLLTEALSRRRRKGLNGHRRLPPRTKRGLFHGTARH